MRGLARAGSRFSLARYPASGFGVEIAGRHIAVPAADRLRLESVEYRRYEGQDIGMRLNGFLASATQAAMLAGTELSNLAVSQSGFVVKLKRRRKHSRLPVWAESLARARSSRWRWQRRHSVVPIRRLNRCSPFSLLQRGSSRDGSGSGYGRHRDRCASCAFWAAHGAQPLSMPDGAVSMVTARRLAVEPYRARFMAPTCSTIRNAFDGGFVSIAINRYNGY